MLKFAAMLRAPFVRRTMIVRSTPEFDFAVGAGWPNRILAEVVTDRLHKKQGRSIARWSRPPLVMFLKRHYRLPWWQGLLARLGPGRAWSPGLQEWQHLDWARSQGLPVPRALAAVEWRGPGLTLQSVLAVEELTGMLPLHEAIPLAQRSLAPTAFATWKRRLVRELARLSAELHRRRAFHKDHYLCHFYIAESDCRRTPDSFAGRMCVIDLHRLGRHPLLRHHFQIKDVAQLLYSSLEVPGVTARDRLRYWRHYRPYAAGWVRWAVLWKYRLYLRHSRRKAARKANG